MTEACGPEWYQVYGNAYLYYVQFGWVWAKPLNSNVYHFHKYYQKEVDKAGVDIGIITAGVALTIITGGTAAPTVGGFFVAVGIGAGLGAVGGAAHAMIDNKPPNEVFKQSAMGALIGGVGAAVGYGIGKGVQSAANKMMKSKLLADNYIVTNKGNVVKQPGVPDDPSTINIFRGTETYSDAILDAGYVATLTKGEMALVRFAENATQTLGVMFGAGAGVMGYTMEPGMRGSNGRDGLGNMRLAEGNYGFSNTPSSKPMLQDNYRITRNGNDSPYFVHEGTNRSWTKGCILLSKTRFPTTLNSSQSAIGNFNRYIINNGVKNVGIRIY